MTRFYRYLIIIIGIIAITALLIYSQSFLDPTYRDTPVNSSVSNTQTSEEEEELQTSEENNSSTDDTQDTSSSTENEHLHQAGESWLFDQETHWKECICGERMENALHEYEWLEDVSVASGYVKLCACGYRKEIEKTILPQRQELNLCVKVQDGEAVVNTTQTVCVSLDEEIGTTIFVKYNGKEIESKCRGQEVHILASEFGFDYGNTQLEILTDTTYYHAPILLITKQITTKQQLDELNVLSKACETEENVYGGYFTLGKNIEYDGEWQNGIATQITERAANSGNVGFCGVFDGRGYSISGMQQKGNYMFDAFIGVLYGGSIKNVQFTNATLLYCGGFVCAAGVGSIQNVSVKYAQFGGETEREDYFGTFFGTWAREGASVQDCIIDCQSATLVSTAYGYLIGYMADGETIQDGILQGVYAIGVPLMQKIVFSGEERTDFFGAYVTAEDLKKDLAAQSEMNTWDTEIWTIENGIPQFKNR